MKIPLGMSLPHRSPDAIDMLAVRQVAQRADALGFRDLWVTENTLDHVFCFDPVVVLTYAAAVTTSIRLGVAVVVLPVHNPIHVAHQVATLDYVSHGRAILGVGLGRDHHYTQFQVSTERRVRESRPTGVRSDERVPVATPPPLSRVQSALGRVCADLKRLGP